MQVLGRPSDFATALGFDTGSQVREGSLMGGLGGRADDVDLHLFAVFHVEKSLARRDVMASRLDDDPGDLMRDDSVPSDIGPPDEPAEHVAIDNEAIPVRQFAVDVTDKFEKRHLHTHSMRFFGGLGSGNCFPYLLIGYSPGPCSAQHFLLTDTAADFDQPSANLDLAHGDYGFAVL